MTVPVALMIFNRPAATHRVLASVRLYHPATLFVVADGPRSEAEAVQCEAARAVIEQVDWDCKVLTNYSDFNMGCDPRVESGINWVFEHCEEAILLEDDCVPVPTFFEYCAQLLERYRHDERVVMISGYNCLRDRHPVHCSYYFTRSFLTWGWATWRRAWQHYPEGLDHWPVLRSSPWLADLFGDPEMVAWHRDHFDALAAGNRGWDFRWAFACLLQHGLAIAPAVNLVTNIGSGEGATHTTHQTRGLNLPTGQMAFPLTHPRFMILDSEADRLVFDMLARPDLYGRLRRLLVRAMPRSVRDHLYHHLSTLEHMRTAARTRFEQR